MDIFEYQKTKMQEKNTPLANKIRPKTLEEFVGQKQILKKDGILYNLIKNDKLTSLIFYGPPGTGKTTLAKIISNTTNANFIQINGVIDGSKQIKEIFENIKNNFLISLKKTILFIDEIHRLNKAQQDLLLPFVEDGTIILIGATTENPYFEINNSLISRSVILKLESLTNDDIKSIIINTLENEKDGLGSFNIKIDENAINFIVKYSNGDARRAINLLEIITFSNDLTKIITEDIVKKCIFEKSINYDKNSDNHYDNISAFIKSIRGSDADAAIYYLARMLKGGEDPKFIARRLIISASEDIGNADPYALTMAINAFNCVQIVGMPEARITLAQVTAYLANAKKSNSSYLAINKAFELVENVKINSIPTYLKDGHYFGADKLNNVSKYLYPHDYENGVVEQQYLPDELIYEKIYIPKSTENNK